MWLIDTNDFMLTRFVNHENVDYAILSHTWLPYGEVSFTEIQRLHEARLKEGWSKIEQSCRIAKLLDLNYIWIDTCCIDKSSSAELSESINSMFEYYRRSSICIVYLEDLPSTSDSLHSTVAQKQLDEHLGRCRWWTRGWTLQELIAPKETSFFDSRWQERGSKISLKSRIRQITGIPFSVLSDSENMSMIPVGQRMSWASMRNTTRVEDVAYSLLGIFDISMPLIYGEGRKAFIRLQEAIVQQTNDLSLFAWTSDADQRYHGMFAASPQEFRSCQRIENSADPMAYERLEFELTNRGLRFQNFLAAEWNDGDYLMNLNCLDKNMELPRNVTLAIRLTKTTNGFIRHMAHKLFACPVSTGHFSTFVVPKLISATESRHVANQLNNSFQFIFRSPKTWYYTLAPSSSSRPKEDKGSNRNPHNWHEKQKRFLTGSRPSFTGLLNFEIDFRPNPALSDSHLDGKFKIICGFWPDADSAKPQEREENEDADQTELRPWACLYQLPDGKTPANRIFTELSGQFPARIHQTLDREGSAHLLQFSLRLSEVMHESLLQGATLPTSARLIPYRLKDSSMFSSHSYKYDKIAAGSTVSISLDVSSERGDEGVVHNVVIQVAD